MKTKLLILISVLFATSYNSNAQKVKIKKGIVSVDDKEYLKTNKDYGNEIISTLDGKDIIKLEWNSFDVPNPARNNANDPARYNYPATIKNWYAVASFLDFNITFETELSQKNIFEALYKDKVVDESGKVNEENAKSLAKKIHKNVSGNRPDVLIIY
jgi:hypothetical protein